MASQDEKEVQFENLESLFAADLADIADLASFETPPTGSYILKVSTSTKKINKKDAVVADFEVMETVELKEDDETAEGYRPPSKDGTKFSISYILGNNIATGRLKQFLAPFAEHFGQTNVGKLVRDDVKEVTIAASVLNRPSKDDPEVIYAGIKNIIIQ